MGEADGLATRKVHSLLGHYTASWCAPPASLQWPLASLSLLPLAAAQRGVLEEVGLFPSLPLPLDVLCLPLSLCFILSQSTLRPSSFSWLLYCSTYGVDAAGGPTARSLSLSFPSTLAWWISSLLLCQTCIYIPGRESLQKGWPLKFHTRVTLSHWILFYLLGVSDSKCFCLWQFSDIFLL